MTHNIYVYIFVMAGVSYLIRVLPLTLIRRKLENRFLVSFLYYVPYVTLAVMTFPAILGNLDAPFIELLPGLAALVVGVVLAWLGAGLFPVAAACCIAVFLVQLFTAS
ncbi:MAG: AzlD domain-containing protein [Oscillospiraceae bacterium]|nr:AzlD domain-containing protein [Oscillospiraceae bacterium]